MGNLLVRHIVHTVSEEVSGSVRKTKTPEDNTEVGKLRK